ncbi:actin-histidine N-methyltransferase-like isoform X2 [Gigantopelta aegis]|uniref:actin-histidine N-methyltransferase-like isoform X2 n=1 Tax=Gigantopelta aegis TaxID=1735272 RepID=UPI001B88C4B4|nr:actin-histidine N-methyltransferase-like isoform X2 [Gigantopelta aegis]
MYCRRMGRKSRKGGGKTSPPTTGATCESPTLSKAARKEIGELVSQLLQVCSKPVATGVKEWEDYPEIHGLIEKIRKLQSPLAPAEKNREEFFPAFLGWLKENGVQTNSVEIVNYPSFGFGLQARQDLKEPELFLSIPRKLMMTVDSAKKSGLGAVYAEDKIMQAMPNITLALHLLCEKKKADSFWKPYIDILPSSYTTPLYFGEDDLQHLKGSPAHGDSLSQYRNIARQYAYFYRLLQKSPAASSLAIKDSFTFDDYRWAVSSVMTRQNQIPTPDGSRVTFGLIPLWDMCNHTNGYFTADFNVEKDCSECFCLRDFNKDEQIYIFYGARSNAEFLVHNGFVYPENENDRLCLKLGISKGDPLFVLKSEVLSKVGLESSRAFFLHCGDNPIDGDLLAFLRVFNMEEELLKERFSGEMAAENLQKLKELEHPVSPENDQKVWNFIEMRASLILKSYPTTREDDEEELQKEGLSEPHRLALQLRVCEKTILQNTVKYAAKAKQEETVENGT